MSVLVSPILSVLVLSPTVVVAGLLPAPHAPHRVAARIMTRAPQLRLALANDTRLTVGDMLGDVIKKQITELPDDEQAARAARAIDAIVASSAAEMDACRAQLDRDLQAASRNTTLLLKQKLQRTEQRYLVILNRTAAAIDATIAPSRASTRASSAELRAELQALRDAKEREIARAGVGSASSWRDDAALARFTSQPQHPVALVAQAASLALSVLLLLAFGDFVSTRHQLTSPVHISHVQMHMPRRTSTPTPTPVASAATDGMFSLLAEQQQQEEQSAPKPKTAAAAAAAPAAPSPARQWWRAIRWMLVVYMGSLGYILTRAGSGEEWASLALGIMPASPEAAAAEGEGDGRRRVAGAPARKPGLVKWVYDFQRDQWREE